MKLRAKHAHVCILSEAGQPVGGGVLVSPNHVATCAHVVALAWPGCEMDIQEPLAEEIKIVFPWRDPNFEISATVNRETWQPYVKDVPSGDLAILELAEPVKNSAVPSQKCERFEDKTFEVWGHHTNGRIGAEIGGTIVAQMPNRWLQLKSSDGSKNYFIVEGASGCGIFLGDDLAGIVAAYVEADDLKVAYALGAEILREALSKLGVAVPKEVVGCERVIQRVDELLPEFGDALPPEGASILKTLDDILEIANNSEGKPSRLAKLLELAELFVASRFDHQEVVRMRRELSTDCIVRAETEPFSGGEMRFAAVEDRPASFREDDGADPRGTHNVCPLPNPGLSQEIRGDDVKGRLGTDLDERLNEELDYPYRLSVTTEDRVKRRRNVVLETLEFRADEGKPRYYYTCHDDEEDWQQTAENIQEYFSGTVPLVLLTSDSEKRNDDRKVMHKLAKIQRLCGAARL